MAEFVAATLGQRFTEPPPFDLAGAFLDSCATSPLLFILSRGADPAAALTRFAEERGYGCKLAAMSLGQGQGPKAARLIAEARKTGGWVLLQARSALKGSSPSQVPTCRGSAVSRTGSHFTFVFTSAPASQDILYHLFFHRRT